MYELSLDDFKNTLEELPDGILIVRATDDVINNIEIVYANKMAAVFSKFNFKEKIGQKLEEAYQQDMSENAAAKIWMRLSKEGGTDEILGIPFKNSLHPLGVFNAKFYAIGNGCVVSHYTNILHKLETEESGNKSGNQIELVTAMLGIK